LLLVLHVHGWHQSESDRYDAKTQQCPQNFAHFVAPTFFRRTSGPLPQRGTPGGDALAAERDCGPRGKARTGLAVQTGFEETFEFCSEPDEVSSSFLQFLAIETAAI
jgi:hypothetical protein